MPRTIRTELPAIAALAIAALVLPGCESHSVNLPPDLPPVVTAHADVTSGDAPLTVHFTATASDPDGRVVQWAWAFGDGGTSAQQNPTHVYATAGSFPATVTVRDDWNAAASSSVTIAVVVNRAPVANAGADTTVSAGSRVWLDGRRSSDPDGDVLAYQWSQLGGPIPAAPATASDARTSTVPFLAGTYTYRLVVSDQRTPALRDTDTLAVQVTALQLSSLPRAVR